MRVCKSFLAFFVGLVKLSKCLPYDLAMKIDPQNTMDSYSCHFAIIDFMRIGKPIPVKGNLCVFPIQGDTLKAFETSIVQVSCLEESTEIRSPLLQLGARQTCMGFVTTTISSRSSTTKHFTLR